MSLTTAENAGDGEHSQLGSAPFRGDLPGTAPSQPIAIGPYLVPKVEPVGGPPKVPVIWTGGTIASVSSVVAGVKRLKPGLTGPDFEAKYLRPVDDEAELEDVCDIDWRTVPGLPPEGIDSSNFTETTILSIEHIVFGILNEKYHSKEKNPTGVVLAQGTDTMSATASYLSFALHNLPTSVVLTGAQIAPSSGMSDAVRNMTFALRVAKDTDLCEVGIAFAGKFYRGSSTQKMEAVTDLDTFDSPHMHHLAEILGKNSLQIYDLPQPRQRKNLTVDERCTPPALYPTLSGNTRIIPMRPMLADVSPKYSATGTTVDPLNTKLIMEILHGGSIDAAILAGYAAGNLPLNVKDILAQIADKVHIIVAPGASTRGAMEDIYEVSAKVSHPSLTFADGLTPYAAELKHRFLQGVSEQRKLPSLDKQREWIRSRYGLAIGRDAPLKHNDQYLPATTIIDLLEVKDVLPPDLATGPTKEVIHYHQSLVQNRRQLFLRSQAKKLDLSESDAGEWVHNRLHIKFPISIRDDKAEPRHTLSEHHPDNKIFDPLFNSRTLINWDNPWESLGSMLQLSKKAVHVLMKEWDSSPDSRVRIHRSKSTPLAMGSSPISLGVNPVPPTSQTPPVTE